MSVRRLALPFLALCAAMPFAIAHADGPPYSGPTVKTVTATLIGSNGQPACNVQLNQDSKALARSLLDATKLPAGAHGIHIHATGRCDAPAFTTANAHFNPDNHLHGLNSPQGPHSGDLDQIDAKTVSQGSYTSTTDRISLTGGAFNIFDADGAALVIHAGADDQVTDPTGNSGARIACAVIAEPNPLLATPTATVAPPRPPASGTGTSGGSTSIAPFVVLGALMLLGGWVAVGTRQR